MSTSKLNNCYLYVLDMMADWEFAQIAAELNSGRFLKDGKVAIKKVAESLKPITTMGGMEIKVDLKLSDVEFTEGDLLILPGADTWMAEEHQHVTGMVENLIGRGVVVAAVCGATVALAYAGILDHRKHTSNGKGFLEMVCPVYKGSANFVDTPAVCDGNLITASGMAPLEFAYEILKRTNVMKEATLAAWYKLYSLRDPQYFFELMESMK
ncbi:MAG TPA: type 1 glutamine amidotransferase family protein [Paludibacteraceae bacterium]|nr:type 1 glutamine amidotransferase family protein [Paludibacteraceae bacterium]HOU69012.1 type 1 glutamine amidotransferase family protein [Paludibacteraceae bacterium]HPH63641.1 type 1 glutamine amidotransferase family protein [Paludibacteraceae bacterium]HQF50804.1 type 1 glutamine amidotransferase family protein [Paludibacteraceae bacterium]